MGGGQEAEYDAIVVGSGPNGFAAAITLQRAGLAVLLIEGKSTLGGGMRSAELTLPGFIHDVCSAVHPLGADSPVFKQFNLHQFGLEYVTPEYAIAHPFDDGSAGAIHSSIELTAAQFGEDANAYRNIYSSLVNEWPDLRSAFVGPLHASIPSKAKAKFAYYALSSVNHFAKHQFKTIAAQSLFAGMGAHTMLPLDTLTTSSMAIVLNTLAHVNSWPVPRGGAQQITNALEACFRESGGHIQTGNMITSLHQLPQSKVVLLDVTPTQLLSIAGDKFSALYKWQLQRYKYGAGIFKIDWALSQPVPFINDTCKRATTVHIGGGIDEIYASEATMAKNKYAEKPFVLFVQPGVADASRAPEGKHTAWAYCHVPNGSTIDMTDAIEKQVERFAPGFKDCILEKSVMNTRDVEAYNPNYIGGDINGGAAVISQLFTRPVLRISPYRTSATGVYVCSSSTPPGGGVHGICGYYAARRALKDLFGIQLPWL
ncbi:MAG: NAD(P)/FAD-dependent oxidoreductase [Bacteroidota bacterium]|nr:NAD(P)/FAD-dependent oxidoreductase [Bacteroidota bacterium]